MDEYITSLNELLNQNKKNEFYQKVIEYSNMVYQNIQSDQNKVTKFNELLNIVGDAMKVEDAVVIMDILEYEMGIL